MSITNLLVYKVDVGNLAPDKIQDYMNRNRAYVNNNNLIERLAAQGTEILFIPVRANSESSIEMMSLPLGDEQRRIEKLEDVKLQIELMGTRGIANEFDELK